MYWKWDDFLFWWWREIAIRPVLLSLLIPVCQWLLTLSIFERWGNRSQGSIFAVTPEGRDLWRIWRRDSLLLRFCFIDYRLRLLYVNYRCSVRDGDIHAPEWRVIRVRVRRRLAVDILRVRGHRHPVVRRLSVAGARGPRISPDHTARREEIYYQLRLGSRRRFREYIMKYNIIKTKYWGFFFFFLPLIS